MVLAEMGKPMVSCNFCLSVRHSFIYTVCLAGVPDGSCLLTAKHCEIPQVLSVQR